MFSILKEEIFLDHKNHMVQSCPGSISKNIAIKNKVLFQSNKYSAGKEVGKERRKEGRQGGREEGRNEAESGISGHLLKVALQLYLFDLTYILYAHSRHVVHYICIYIYIDLYLEYYIYIFIYLYLEYYIYIYLNPECHIQPTAAHGTGIVILPWGEAPRPCFCFGQNFTRS